MTFDSNAPKGRQHWLAGLLRSRAPRFPSASDLPLYLQRDIGFVQDFSDTPKRQRR